MKYYALAVCFATLLCAAITFGFFVFNIVKVVSPELTMHPHQLKIHQSVESYREITRAAPRAALSTIPSDLNGEIRLQQGIEQLNIPELSDKEVEARISKGRASAIASHTFRAKQGMLLQAIILSICGALYYLHWRLAKKLELENTA